MREQMSGSAWNVVFSAFGHFVENRISFISVSVLLFLHQILSEKGGDYHEIPISKWI